jgi:flagellar assembly factor FliW
MQAQQIPTAMLDVLGPGGLFFPEGIPAFEEHTRFTLIDDERYYPIRTLQSLVEAEVGFLVVDPHLVVPGYAPDLADQDLGALELERDQVLDLLCLLVVHRDGQVTANLKAPVAINRARRRGKQLILVDERFPLRYQVDLTVLCAESAKGVSCLS